MKDIKIKECLFCKSQDQKFSNEHVIPQWLQKHLGITKTMIFPKFIERDQAFKRPHELFKTETKVVSERKHTFMGMVSGEVCVVCNNGWMANLESEAMRILIPLIDGKREDSSLTQEERFLVARWATKTAYTYSWSANYERIVPIEHLHRFKENTEKMEDGTAVFIYSNKLDDVFIGRQTRHWVRQDFPANLMNEKQWHNLVLKSYKISFMMGKIHLMVAYWPPLPHWMFLAEPQFHKKVLWNWQKSIAFNIMGSNKPPTNSQEAHLAFHTLLGLSYKI